MAIEANYDSYPIMELQRLGYDNQYVREKMDEYTGKVEKKYGFKTTQITRPVIISNLIEIVREHTELINDKDTLEELLTIIRNEKGRIEAPVGGHDDQMMGLAIAHESRGQVIFDNPEPFKFYTESAFNLDYRKVEEQEMDYGEKETVI
jgi:phage terminase large subunit